MKSRVYGRKETGYYWKIGKDLWSLQVHYPKQHQRLQRLSSLIRVAKSIDGKYLAIFQGTKEAVLRASRKLYFK